jgi:hypothetical protein
VRVFPGHGWSDDKVIDQRSTTTDAGEIPVVIINTRPDVDTDDALQRLDRALKLIERYAPHHFRRLRRDFARILIQRYACRGAYSPVDKTCLVELTFVVNRDFSEAQVAATILHEAMHARLHTLGISMETVDRPRQERFCRRAEIEFGLAVPDGQAIVERARGALAGSDDDVAPTVDPILAARRIAQVDREALDASR